MSADEYNRIRHCCITKTQSCLEAIYESLQSGTLDPFILDDDGLSGLDYLLMPDEEGHGSGYFLVYRIYTELLVKYIELYYEFDQNDPILHRNLQKICTDSILFNALEERLRRTVGLLLHTYCKPAMPAGGVEVMKGTYAEGESSDSLPAAEQMEHGIAIPVSPERNFVIGQEAELYERQQTPPDLRAFREAEKRGGLRKKKTKKGGKKGSKKGSKKRNKKGKSKRTKRTRKSRN
jgi:hypothetical protein